MQGVVSCKNGSRLRHIERVSSLTYILAESVAAPCLGCYIINIQVTSYISKRKKERKKERVRTDATIDRFNTISLFMY